MMKIDETLFEDLYWDEEDGLHFLPHIKGLPQKEKKPLTKGKKLNTPLQEQVDNLREYQFSYRAARHEEWWLLDSLGPFFDEQWFDDVLGLVKGGKEASVYLCQANPSANTPFMAAKVYRPRALRNLRKDHLYREGRARLDADGLEIVDGRMARAMQKRTTFGKNLMHTSWIEHEYRTMKILDAAGCDIPKPYASDHNAILMDFIGEAGMAAPTLNGIHLEPKEAKVLFEQIVHNLELMLAHQRVHGDFSAYNILYWDGEITLIDFPQAINPSRNPNAYAIFQRDVVRICEYFQTQGQRVNAQNLAENLWTAQGLDTAPNMLWGDDDNDEIADLYEEK